MFKTETQQGPTVQHMELCSTLWGSLVGREVWRRNPSTYPTYVCMAESLSCSSETVTRLLIGYGPTQNKKFFLTKTCPNILWPSSLQKWEPKSPVTCSSGVECGCVVNQIPSAWFLLSRIRGSGGRQLPWDEDTQEARERPMWGRTEANSHSPPASRVNSGLPGDPQARERLQTSAARTREVPSPETPRQTCSASQPPASQPTETVESNKILWLFYTSI